AAAAVAVGVSLADLLTPGIRRCGSGACCIFPLSFGEQPVGLTGYPGEPCCKALSLVPADVDHRPLAASPAAVADMRVAIPITDAGVPLVERHLELRHGEALSENDFMLRLFIAIVAHFIGGRSHHELAGGDDHHLGAVPGTFPESRSWLQRPLGLCAQS